MVCACILPAGTLMEFPAQVLRSTAFHLVHVDVTWVDMVPFIQSKLNPSSIPLSWPKSLPPLPGNLQPFASRSEVPCQAQAGL